MDVWGGAGNILGCMALLFSPGELARMDVAGGIDFMKIAKNVAKITLNLVDYFWPLIFLICLLGIMYIYPKYSMNITIKILLKEMHILAIPCIYFLGFLISAYSMALSPQFPARVWSGPLVFLLIAILSFYTEIVSDTEYEREHIFQFRKLAPFFVMCFLCVYIKAFVTIIVTDIHYDVRMEMIQEAVEKGEDEIFLPAIISNSKYTCYDYRGDLGYGSEGFVNNGLAKYYGFSKVIRDDSAGEDVKNEHLRWFNQYI